MRKVACAYFEGTFVQDSQHGNHPGTWLAHAIEARCASAAVVKKWYLPRWFVEVKMSSGELVVIIRFRRPNRWFISFMPQGKIGSSRLTAEIINIAHEVDQLLSASSDMKGLRWYIPGSTSSVATPEELLWT